MMTSHDSVVFDAAPLILSDNQELGVVPNGALMVTRLFCKKKWLQASIKKAVLKNLHKIST
jgi:hypothetical protein